MYDDQQSDRPVEQRPNRTAALYASERSAKAALCEKDPRCRIPSPAQKRALLVGFAMQGKSLVGAAFDAVRLNSPVDLDDPYDIAQQIDAITIIEIKSTNRGSVGEDLAGYFFNITSAELLVAQLLKDQYRFVFFHTVRADWQELSLTEVLSKAKAIYPAFHIRL